MRNTQRIENNSTNKIKSEGNIKERGKQQKNKRKARTRKIKRK